MFFAAFEKKWWKSNSSEGQSSTGELEKDLASKEFTDGAVEDVVSKVIKRDESRNPSLDEKEDLKEISDVVLNTSQSDWVKSEDKIAHQDEYDEDSDEEEDDEVFSNDDNFEQVDPHAPPAFNLDDSHDEPELSRGHQKSKVGSIKEFFNTEILYRYDILDDRDREAIKGDYRIELSGEESGSWSISLARDIDISSEKKPNAVVLKLDSEDFLSIVNGKINSQIALVSKRIRIEGDSKKASLLQNILAPRVD